MISLKLRFAIPGAAAMQSLCWYKLNSPQGSAMDGRAPCGFLLSFGERGGIIGDVGEMWERTGASRGEDVGRGLMKACVYSLCVQ